MRPSKRKNNQLREISIEKGVLNHAEGSCLVKFGNTHVICSASVDESVPRFLKGTKSGWVTAEYSMLPRSTGDRMRRESSSTRPSGRTLEIQRLIGRSMRAAIDLKLLGERQIIIDADVINADGGTRTAAITGGYVALHLAVRSLLDSRKLKANPLISQIAAISCGILGSNAILDMDYMEDSKAEVDANFVFNQKGNLIEVQATGEETDFTPDQLSQMMNLASDSMKDLFKIQNQLLLELI